MKNLSLSVLLLLAVTACQKAPEEQPPEEQPGAANTITTPPVLMPTSRPSKAGVPAPTKVAEPAPVASAKLTHVDAKGAADLIAADSKKVVLDVRTAAEFTAGHITCQHRMRAQPQDNRDRTENHDDA